MIVYLLWITPQGDKENILWRVFKDKLEAIKERDSFEESYSPEITEEEVWE